jgi:hypothetical protein
VTFSPQLSVASREKDAELAAAAAQIRFFDVCISSPSITAIEKHEWIRCKGYEGGGGTETKEKTEDELVEGDYWVKPELFDVEEGWS